MNFLLVGCPECGANNRIAAGKQHLGPKCGRCGQPLKIAGAAVPVDLSDAELQDLITNASLPVLLALLSPTCGYCRAMNPTLEQLARRFLGRFIVARLDVSRHPHTASRFRIQGVPTLLFFKGGNLVDQVTGAASEPMLVQKMETLAV